MLVSVPKRFYELQRLHVFDKGGRNSISGIQATVFGGTSATGTWIGTSLTKMGSRCIYPYRAMASVYDVKMRELKTTADLGYKQFIRLNDFTSV